MQILDLINSGVLKPGTKIIMKKKGNIYKAEIQSDGKIKDQNGNFYKSLSGAARANNSGKPIDGWMIWKLESDEKISMHQLRNLK